MINLCLQVPHETVLEVGCAEGYFTQQLCKISAHVVAIDVSPLAIMRAKKRAPEVTFKNVTLNQLQISQKKFDLIICSEVLYYTIDMKRAIKKLARLGRYLVTSHFLMKNWPGYVSEYSLRKQKLLKRKIVFSLKEKNCA